MSSWTDQQRDAAAKEGWGYRLTFSARLVGLVLGADALFIGAQKVGQYLQIRGQHRIKPLTFKSSTCKLLDDDFK
ncbi:hypothetical protein MTR67_052138 [Solanum verrucosum]|uniref:Uncharacterized protein n=1 Tax=Solanum verrucosum TaxID=315347 RepID=A0AAF0V8Q6_SOLVR|nr:hypothetical protein MTR67_052138 [Solanum verrucosum]